MYIVHVNRTASPARRSLAELNEGFASSSSTADFDLLTDYRVGKWGLAISRDGYQARGQGGEHRHLSIVTTIAAIHPDYNWRPYCAETVSRGRYETAEQHQANVARQLASHGAAFGHYCRQPKVGDIVAVRPVCRFENVRGTGAFTAEQADTAIVDCINCRRGFFGEQVDVVAVQADRRAAVEARKAAKPQPARCFVCGEVRPQTKATLAGEQLPCSYCKESLEKIWWVETTGYSCQYFAEFPKPHLLEEGIQAENRACDQLERAEARAAKKVAR